MLIVKRKKKRKKKRKVDYYTIGSKIFIMCLFFLAAIYFIDILLGLCDAKHVGVTKEVLETVKTLLFTISGYLFGRNANHYSEDKMKMPKNEEQR